MNRERSEQKDLKTAEAAAQWLYALREPDFDRQEDYLQWLLESPRHVEAFLRVSMVDASLGRIDPQLSIVVESAGIGSAASNVVTLSGKTPPQGVRRRSRRAVWALAASLTLVVATVVGWWARGWDGQGRWTHYVTAVGEQRAIELEDGSLLHMNTGSRVEVRYSATERSIRLMAGEALFRVQSEPARPFRVHSSGAVIQAVGTQFNVLRHASGSQVSVLEGRVRVDGESHAAETKFLGAGEQAQLTNDGRVTELKKADLARVNAWRQRRLVFVNETLGAIVEEFNRYNRSPQIRVEGAAADLREYEALSFNADDPESLLAVLERDASLTIERRPDRVIVRRRGP